MNEAVFQLTPKFINDKVNFSYKFVYIYFSHKPSCTGDEYAFVFVKVTN